MQNIKCQNLGGLTQVFPAVYTIGVLSECPLREVVVYDDEFSRDNIAQELELDVPPVGPHAFDKDDLIALFREAAEVIVLAGRRGHIELPPAKNLGAMRVFVSTTPEDAEAWMETILKYRGNADSVLTLHPATPASEQAAGH